MFGNELTPIVVIRIRVSLIVAIMESARRGHTDNVFPRLNVNTNGGSVSNGLPNIQIVLTLTIF